MDCIEHGGSVQNNGYGQVRRNGKLWLAHRWAALLAHGPCPPGQVVRHSCSNRLCVNPAHLSYGTQGDNLLDRRDSGKVYRKLDAARVAVIKSRLIKGEMLRVIAADYGVSTTMISNIKNGRQWS